MTAKPPISDYLHSYIAASADKDIRRLPIRFIWSTVMLESYDYRRFFSRDEILAAVATVLPMDDAARFIEELYAIPDHDEALLSPAIAAALANISPECAERVAALQRVPKRAGEPPPTL
jgi:hypothetical protein